MAAFLDGWYCIVTRICAAPRQCSGIEGSCCVCAGGIIISGLVEARLILVVIASVVVGIIRFGWTVVAALTFGCIGADCVTGGLGGGVGWAAIKLLDEYYCRIQLLKVLVASGSLSTEFNVWYVMVASTSSKLCVY